MLEQVPFLQSWLELVSPLLTFFSLSFHHFNLEPPSTSPPSPPSCPEVVFSPPHDQPECPVCNVYVAIGVTFLVTLLFFCLVAALVGIMVAWWGRRRRKKMGHYDVQPLAAEQ